MILVQVIQVFVLWLCLSQGCQLRYTRKALARQSGRRSNNFDKQTTPGKPWKDYPDYDAIPETSFSCDKQMKGGYYADPETRCQVYHICSKEVGKTGLTKKSVLCPKGTQFQQKDFVCDWWFNVDCSTTEDFYRSNRKKGRAADPTQLGSAFSVQQVIDCARGDPVTGRRKGYLDGATNVPAPYDFKTGNIDECEDHCDRDDNCKFYQLEKENEECLLKATDGVFKCNQDYEVGPRNRPNDQSAFSAGQTCTKPCSGPDCSKVKAMLGHLIDFSVDPCRDFFAFACSTKTRGTTPPVAPRRIKIFQELVLRPPTGFEYIKNFFLSCTKRWPKNTTKEVFSSCIEDDGKCTEDELRPFGDIFVNFFKMANLFLHEYSFPAFTSNWGERPAGKDFEWWDLSAKVLDWFYLLAASNLLGSIPGDNRADFFRSNVFLAPLVDSVATRDYDERHTIYMVPQYIPESILQGDVFSLALHKKLMQVMFTSFGATPGPQMDEDIEMVLEMEQDVGAITVEKLGTRYTKTEAHWTKEDFEKHGQKITVESLYAYMPSVEWQSYLVEAFSRNADVKISRSTEVWIPSINMLRQLENYLKKVSKRDQANFLMWRMLYQLAVDYLVTGFETNDDQIDVFSAMFGNFDTREAHCIAQIKILFPEAKNDMVIAKYVDASQKAGIKDMFDKVRNVYLKIIDEQSWMSDRTKRKARKKVKDMKLNVGVFSPQTEKYKQLKQTIGVYTYFWNILHIGNYRRGVQVQNLGKDLKEHRPYGVCENQFNAYYMPYYNQFVILTGLIHGSLGIGLDFDIPKGLLYGGFKTLGHEMMHAFDDTGKLFDENGFRHNWWTEEENDEYKKRTQCLVGHLSLIELGWSLVVFVSF